MLNTKKRDLAKLHDTVYVAPLQINKWLKPIFFPPKISTDIPSNFEKPPRKNCQKLFSDG